MPPIPDAALQRLLAEEPFVRLLARTLLAADSDEVVQRTWLHALRHGGDDVGAPRSWLARIARNVAANLRRERRRRERHERDAGSGSAAAGAVPSSAELMQREEGRHALVAAVDALPAPLRAVVLLRYFDGLPPRAIAQRLELPVATVWNQLRRALELLRERLDAAHGGERRAWALPLVPFAAGLPALPPVPPFAPPALPAAAATGGAMTFAAGVIAMTMKAKLVASAGVLLAAAAAFALWRTYDDAPSGSPIPHGAREAPPLATAALPRDRSAPTAVAGDAGRKAAPAAAPAPTTGSVIVRLRYADDGVAAAGVTVIVAAPREDLRLHGRRRTTDPEGTARFDQLAPGSWRVHTDHCHPPWPVEVRAGETTELDAKMPVGLTLTGIVVDPADVPVAGARVEVGRYAFVGADIETLAVTGADGRFHVRAAPPRAVVGARAEGHAAAPMQHVFGKDGNTADVRLQLGPPAGTVDGVVVDERGTPIPGAMVKVGAGPIGGARIVGTAIPARARTDEHGRFRAVGVLPGAQPVEAHAPDRAPWTGTCEVTAGLAAPLRIVLEHGARIRGVVRNENGEPVRGADVEIGTWDDFVRWRERSGDDGSFALGSLAAGSLRLLARHEAHGRGEVVVHTSANATSDCELRLLRGLVLRGRVSDEAGAPVADALVECLANGTPMRSQHARTVADGTFTVVDCPAGDGIRLSVRAAGFEEHVLPEFAAGAAPMELRLRRLSPATVRITGVVTDPNGKVLPNASVSAHGRHAGSGPGIQSTGPDGRFVIAPLVPGTWTVHVQTKEHPSFHSEARELGADATWDLGTIALESGGRARVTLDGAVTRVRLRIADRAQATWSGLTGDGAERLSPILATGEHLLFVEGPSIAAHVLPFAVRAGETTNVAVTAVAGVNQRFDVPPLQTDLLPAWVRLRVTRGDEPVANAGYAPRPGKPGEATMCLAPGTYTVRASIDERDRELAHATFTVGEREGPPVQLTLR